MKKRKKEKAPELGHPEIPCNDYAMQKGSQGLHRYIAPAASAFSLSKPFLEYHKLLIFENSLMRSLLH